MIYYVIGPYLLVVYKDFFSIKNDNITFNLLKPYVVFELVFVIIRFIIMLIMLNDRKPKEVVEWLILGLVLVHAESAIPVFLVWNLYKHQEDKQFETK